MAYAGWTSWWSGVRFDFNPGARVASAGHILVGLGDPQDHAQAGIALSHKYAGSGRQSVTDFVHHADGATVARWRQRFGEGWSRVQCIVLEDLSLDTCFALLLFERRLRTGGEALDDAQIAAWSRYVTRWEQGYLPGHLAVEDSFAMLATTLGHSYLLLSEGMRGAIVESEAFNAGARAVLGFIAGALALCEDPSISAAASLPQSVELDRARVHLGYERDAYQRALALGTTCQLAVPMSQSGRQLLVDALILEEQTPSALLKVFARRDHVRGTTGRGFELLALYRPSMRGSGNDMVISVSKESGLSLQSLWQRLEQLEDEAWGADRPRDAPRPVHSYLNRAEAPNQPWWDDGGHHSLIAAPKSLAEDGGEPYGSRLNWHDHVLPSLWSCYCPVPPDLVIEPAVLLHQKAFVVVRWPQGHGRREVSAALLRSPTLAAWLKTRSADADAPQRPLTSSTELPPARSFKRVEFNGGFAVIDQNGVTVLDDWTESTPPIKELHAIFEELTDRHHRLSRLLGELQDNLDASLAREVHDISPTELAQWKSKILTTRAALMEAQARQAMTQGVWQLEEFRSQLSSVLDLTERGREMLEASEHLDRSFSERAEHALEQRKRQVATAGAALASAFATYEILEMLQPLCVGSLRDVAVLVTQGPSAVEALQHLAERLHHYEIATVWIVALMCLAGGLVYWRFGGKLGGE